jgi:membrane AbrB-like protein
MSRLFTLIWAIVCGAFADQIAIPLPWVLGPMFGVGFLTLAGLSESQPVIGKRLGQLSIGLALGLYFTTEVIAQVASLGLWMILGAFFSVALTIIFSRVFQRMSGASGMTSIYSSAIGAASDMAIQAQAAGGDAASVATSHAVRLMIVVTAIPFLAASLGTGTAELISASRADIAMIAPTPLMIVTGIAFVLAFLANRFNIMPNAWVLVPMAVAAVYAAMGNETRLPDPLVAGGSLLIGWGLGQYMTREFFQASPRVLQAAVVMTLGMLGLSLIFAYLVTDMMGLPLITAIVATSPGGIAEMAITAKVLSLGAPMVTAFHLIRMVLVILIVKRLGRYLIEKNWLKI